MHEPALLRFSAKDLRNENLKFLVSGSQADV